MLLSLSLLPLTKTKTAIEGIEDTEGDAKHPMTEEEKKEQVKRFVLCTADLKMYECKKTHSKSDKKYCFFPRLEELMKARQEERRERERQEEIEREKQRRKQGQELLQVKQKLQEDEMKKLADQRRREKMEDRLAK